MLFVISWNLCSCNLIWNFPLCFNMEKNKKKGHQLNIRIHQCSCRLSLSAVGIFPFYNVVWPMRLCHDSKCLFFILCGVVWYHVPGWAADLRPLVGVGCIMIPFYSWSAYSIATHALLGNLCGCSATSGASVLGDFVFCPFYLLFQAQARFTHTYL